jgi:hypothetical protein
VRRAALREPVPSGTRARQWTERLLAHALESLVWLSLDRRCRACLARDLFEAAWRTSRHPTPRVKAITGHAFAPQPCFVHASGQHEGWPPGEPFCSPWMSSLLVDPLLRYQAITGDSRVDEVFLRLGRYLRDTATTYFHGNPLGDTFFTPRRCYNKPRRDNRCERLSPPAGRPGRLTGAVTSAATGTTSDHCADVTALSAAALVHS